MIGRRSVIGIAVLCALAVSAFATSSASASSATAYTCATNLIGGPGFKAAHCTPEDVVSTGATYKHVEITPKTPTEVSATNERTATNTTAHSPAILHGTVSGVETAVECTKVHGMGTIENKEEAGEMFAHVTGTLTYTECKVTKPVGKECVVKGGEITTNKLTGKTLSAKEAEIKPFEGTEFAKIPIEKCTIAGLNNTFPVQGSLKANLNGATVSSTSAGVTAQNTLKFAGQKAGLQGSLTLGMSTPVADGEAISVT